jgi:hypothetical protein
MEMIALQMQLKKEDKPSLLGRKVHQGRCYFKGGGKFNSLDLAIEIQYVIPYIFCIMRFV